MVARSDVAVVLVSLGLLGALAALVWLVVRSAALPPFVERTAIVRGAPSEVLDDLQVALCGIPQLTARRSAVGRLEIEVALLPAWALVVAVLVFPLGLLALLARRRFSSLILAAPSSQGTQLRFVGPFPPLSVERVNAVIDTRS